MNISLITNLLAFFVMTFGFFSPIASESLFYIGVFALSGGLTNWLAIHMLFEKVPFFYGSGWGAEGFIAICHVPFGLSFAAENWRQTVRAFLFEKSTRAAISRKSS